MEGRWFFPFGVSPKTMYTVYTPLLDKITVEHSFHLKLFFNSQMVKAVLVSPHRKNPENSRRRDTLQAKVIDKNRRILRNKKILKYKKPKETIIRVINYTDLVSPDDMTPSPSAFIAGKPEESSSFVVPSVDAGLSDPWNPYNTTYALALALAQFHLLHPSC